MNPQNILTFSLFLGSCALLAFTIFDYEHARYVIDGTLLIHIVAITSTGSVFALGFGQFRILVFTIMMITSIFMTILLAIIFHQSYTMIPNILLSCITTIPPLRYMYQYYKHLPTKINVIPDETYNEQCSICLEALITETVIIKLDCDHRYHKGCFEKWDKGCPMCRKESTHIVEEYLKI